MKLGIGSYTYAWAIGVPGHLPQHPLTGVDLLGKATDLGVSLVQIADNLPLDKLSEREFYAFEERAAKAGLDIEVGTRGIDPDNLLTYLRLAKRLHSPILRVVIDTADHHPSEDEVVDTIRAMASDFEHAGVILAIENHDRFPAAAFVRMLERIGSDYVGICLDTVNSFGAMEGPEHVVDLLGPWTVNLHIKDFAISRIGHQMGFTVEGRPAGQGQLDIPWLLKALRLLSRDPKGDRISAAILELWTPPQGTLVETIAKEHAWAIESINTLHQFFGYLDEERKE